METIAKLRACVIMIDLGCEYLIIHMFQQLFIAIKRDHKQNVLSFMQSIMSLIIEESDDDSQHFLSTILVDLKQTHVTSSNACSSVNNVSKN